MTNNKRFKKTRRPLQDNFSQNKSSNTFKTETGIVTNPNISSLYSNEGYAINYIALALNHNYYVPLGTHNGNRNFLDSILTPAFTQASQLVSNYKVTVTSNKLQEYFNRVSIALGTLITCRQISAYVKESGTINSAIYDVYNQTFTGEVLQQLDILEQSLLQHYLPPKFVQNVVDHYTWRQSGKTAFSGVIGNSPFTFTNDGMSKQINYQISKLIEIVTATDTIYPIIAKVSSKANIEWAIHSIPEMKGILSYEEEFTSRFINMPILQTCGTANLLCTPAETTNFGALVAEPSVESVLSCDYNKSAQTNPHVGFIDPRLTKSGAFGVIVSYSNSSTLPDELPKTSTSYFNEVFSALGRQVSVPADMKTPVISRMSVPGAMVIQNINDTSLTVLYTKYMNYLFEVPNITMIN